MPFAELTDEVEAALAYSESGYDSSPISKTFHQRQSELASATLGDASLYTAVFLPGPCTTSREVDEYLTLNSPAHILLAEQDKERLAKIKEVHQISYPNNQKQFSYESGHLHRTLATSFNRMLPYRFISADLEGTWHSKATGKRANDRTNASGTSMISILDTALTQGYKEGPSLYLFNLSCLIRRLPDSGVHPFESILELYEEYPQFEELLKDYDAGDFETHNGSRKGPGTVSNPALVMALAASISNFEYDIELVYAGRYDARLRKSPRDWTGIKVDPSKPYDLNTFIGSIKSFYQNGNTMDYYSLKPL